MSELILKTVAIGEVIPYENNPRYNDDAVDAVAESIRQCEYISPIIVDEGMVVLAGHTRLKALKKLGKTEVQVAVKEGLTEEQKKKYRLLDNKTNELAGWDFSKLEKELDGMDFEGFDFGFGSSLPENFDIDSFLTDAEPKEKEPKKIQCPHCGEWFEVE